MPAERKMISLTSGAALTLALLLLTTGTVFGARSLLDAQQELGDERNNVQETVDVVNNPRGSTRIQNGDEERNVLPGQLNLAPRIPIPPSAPSFTDLSDYIPAAKSSFHRNMPHRRSPVPPSALHRTNSLTIPLRQSTRNAHRRQWRTFITGLNSVLPTPPNSAHRFVLVTSVCLRRAPLTARLMIHLLALLITGDIIRPSSLTEPFLLLLLL
ncbi:hypothetical protein KP509_01G036200 [Ceratopteris richardii]|uniref:Uncharacterized protein n=1 Tax=Ceratopteris richardii TaxID=49495 RepID=A0A8T2VC58_CERRI|nr:hypothetical protein KP509_01G036200 [Ceratopteris richardii]